jgi:hypothetical protein
MNQRVARPEQVRRSLLGAALASLVLVSGCSLLFGPSGSYVQTGPQRPARAHDAAVAVFLTRPPAQRYEEIGVIEVGGAGLARRVARAQAEARKRGGDAVVALSSWVQVDENSSTETVETKDSEGKVIATQSVPVTSTSSTPFQTFVIVRLLQRPATASRP